MLGWGTIAVLLSLPAIFRFPWTASDFVIMGLLLGSVGLAIEFLVRRSGNAFARLGSVIAVIAAFLTIWVNMAVGMIGSEDNPYNLLFLLVLVFVLLAGIAVRLRANAMVWILGIAALLQLALALGGMEVDPLGSRFSSAFALPWLFAAALFRGAGIGERPATR